MILDWFDARAASEVGAALADQFALQAASDSAMRNKSDAQKGPEAALKGILQRADLEVRALHLNFFKRAKFANSFKWRLLEKGVDKGMVDEVTQRLVMHLALNPTPSTPDNESPAVTAGRSSINDVRQLLAQGVKCLARDECEEAASVFQDLLKIDPRHGDALNNLGAAFCRLGRLNEAAECFRRATIVRPNDAVGYNNFGNVLRWRGRFVDAEIWLRRALKLNPTSVDARNNLGFTLAFLGRLRDAKANFKKVLKSAPRNDQALFGLGHIAAIEGSFEEASTLFQRALEVNPKMPSAWAAQSSIRKMTSSDAAWLEGAEKIASSGVPPMDEADLRFAMGKYCDDVMDFEGAFGNYERANELLKTAAEPYDRDARFAFVNDMIRVYTREAISTVQKGGSSSTKPVFVVGMMRSGTSLAEQIIASHPAAKGAGELAFWSDATDEHEIQLRKGMLDERTRMKLAEDYLRVLAATSGDAGRIVDKAPINADHLGVIHVVFPNARIIYMQRDPIDTCLSCYFQKLAAGLNFTMDLSDLAHYYREHHRLMAHWRAVLPPGSILDVPYSELVADQEGWTRKILDFLGLEWDDRCLAFHETKRQVVTASYWQVRQKMYKNSIARWRNYKKFIGPLLDLRE